LDERFDAELSAAPAWIQWKSRCLLQGISDTGAEYAMEYARMLQNRAKGLAPSLPRIPVELFRAQRELNPFHAGKDEREIQEPRNCYLILDSADFVIIFVMENRIGRKLLN
jgi:hypothetical protein